MLTGGGVFDFFSRSIISLARSGLGSEGDGRSVVEEVLLVVAIVRLNRRSTAAVRLLVDDRKDVEWRFARSSTSAMKPASYGLAPKLLLIELYVVRSAASETLTSLPCELPSVLSGFTFKDSCLVGTGFLRIDFLLTALRSW
jgi:hypothetical protein